MELKYLRYILSLLLFEGYYYIYLTFPYTYSERRKLLLPFKTKITYFNYIILDKYIMGFNISMNYFRIK